MSHNSGFAIGIPKEYYKENRNIWEERLENTSCLHLCDIPDERQRISNGTEVWQDKKDEEAETAESADGDKKKKNLIYGRQGANYPKFQPYNWNVSS